MGSDNLRTVTDQSYTLMMKSILSYHMEVLKAIEATITTICTLNRLSLNWIHRTYHLTSHIKKLRRSNIKRNLRRKAQRGQSLLQIYAVNTVMSEKRLQVGIQRVLSQKARDDTETLTRTTRITRTTHISKNMKETKKSKS